MTGIDVPGDFNLHRPEAGGAVYTAMRDDGMAFVRKVGHCGLSYTEFQLRRGIRRAGAKIVNLPESYCERWQVKCQQEARSRFGLKGSN